MTTDNAIAVLRRMQEPDPFEPQITQTAFDALEMAIDMIERYSTWSQTYSNMVEDAISRKAAIDALSTPHGILYPIRTIENMPSAQPYTDEEIQKMQGLEQAQFDKMYELGKRDAQPELRWIPCRERLPAYGEDVLISIDGYCNVGHIVSVNEEEQYNWYFSGWYHLPNDVDAWMPLPEPYKEGDDERT